MWTKKRSVKNLSEKYVGIVSLPMKRFESEIDIIKSGLPLLETLQNDPEVFDKLWDTKIKSLVIKFNKSSKPKNRLEAIAFEIPDENKMILLLIADHHPEPVLEIITRLEREVEVYQWSIGAIVGKLDDRIKKHRAVEFIQLKQTQESYLTTATNYFDSDNYVLIRLVGKWTFAAFYNHDAFIELMNYNSFDGDRDFLDVGARELFLIKHLESITPEKERMKTRRYAYDPLLAQLNEIKNSMAGNIVTMAQDLYEHFHRLPSTPSFPQFRTGAPFFVETIKQIVNKHKTLLNSLTNASGQNQATEISDLLAVVDRIGNDFTSLANYLDAISNINDLLYRSRNKRSIHVAVVPGNELSILAINDLIENVESKNVTKQQAYTITYPINWVMRLGSYPLIANPIAHFLIKNSLGTNALIEIGERIEPYVNSESDSQRIRLSSEILAHVTAVNLVGPAYVWALSRFSTGFLQSSKHVCAAANNDIHSCSNSSSMLLLALKICVGIVNRTVTNFSFRSSLLHDFTPIIDENLFEISQELVEKPYTAYDHYKRMPKVQKALMQGQLLKETDSILVLNSLWDAVINKKGYLNEIATVISIADRTIDRYPRSISLAD